MQMPDQQELNFVSFHSGFIRPACDLLDRLGQGPVLPHRIRQFAQASLAEGLCWGSLGAVLGYFPPRAVMTMIHTAFGRNGLIEELLSSHGHILDLAWLRYLQAFPSTNQVNAPDVNLTSDTTAFGAGLSYGLDLARSALANVAVAVFTFDGPSAIDALLYRRKPSQAPCHSKSGPFVPRQ